MTGPQPGGRAVILHADDLGNCHATNSAFAAVAAFGITRCGSIMAPCPWFREITGMAVQHPEWDLGVHITLTSEWPAMRWGPLSTRSRIGGLLDEQGCLPRTVAALLAHVDPQAAEDEMRAQVDAVLDAGVDVTHLDTHMGAVLHPRLAERYLKVALDYRLPAMIQRVSAAEMTRRGVPEDQMHGVLSLVAAAEARGMPVMDWQGGVPLNQPQDRLAQYVAQVQALPAGLSHFYFHPAQDSDELRAATGDFASRAGDLQVMTSPAFRDALAESGVRVTGYRALRDALRTQ